MLEAIQEPMDSKANILWQFWLIDYPTNTGLQSPKKPAKPNGENKVKYENEAKEQQKLRINENEGSYDVTL